MIALATPDAIAAAKIIAASLDKLTSTLTTIGASMTVQLQTISDQVAKTKDVQASAVTLLQGLHDELVAAKDDPAAIQQLADDLKASTDTLAAAVVANTDAAPASP